MKNLFKYRTTQTKEISLWFMRLILSYNKFKNCAQNILVYGFAGKYSCFTMNKKLIYGNSGVFLNLR